MESLGIRLHRQQISSTAKSIYQQAIADHERVGKDFSYWFSVYFDNPDQETYVFKGNKFFIMGKRSNDAWYIWYLRIKPGFDLLTLVKYMPYPLPYISFARELTGRSTIVRYKTNRILKFLSNYGRPNTTRTEKTGSGPCVSDIPGHKCSCGKNGKAKKDGAERSS